MSYPRTSDLRVFMGIASESTKAIYQYWEAKRKGRSMPSRLDIDPIEMKVWLPGIQLIDVYHHPYDIVGLVASTAAQWNVR
jgi:hypothetical protein